MIGVTTLLIINQPEEKYHTTYESLRCTFGWILPTSFRLCGPFLWPCWSREIHQPLAAIMCIMSRLSSPTRRGNHLDKMYKNIVQMPVRFSSWKRMMIYYTVVSIYTHCIYLMKTLFTVILILTWIVFVVSVLLMSPKGWLGLGIGWAAGSNEYGSKKSIESTLKKSALVAGILFCATALFLPYIQ